MIKRNKVLTVTFLTVISLLLVSCGAEKTEELSQKTGEESVMEDELKEQDNIPKQEEMVDYGKDLSKWIYQPDSDSIEISYLKAIDACRYGAAGASLSQVSSAVGTLQLSQLENGEDYVLEYLNGMDVTQLDYFSFQWQMNFKKARALLENPEEHIGELEDSGNENIDLTSFEKEQLDELYHMVMIILEEKGVTDVWKQYTELEPFFVWTE